MFEKDPFIFKKISLDDFDFLKSILQDEELMKLGWGKTYCDLEVKGWINKIIQQYDSYGYSYFIVEEADNKRILGIAGIIKTTINSTTSDEIAYIVKKDYQGLNYGTKIVHQIVDLAFDNFNLPQIVAQFIPENIASKKILEKNGFTYEFSYQRNQNGLLKDHLVYQLKNQSLIEDKKIMRSNEF